MNRLFMQRIYSKFIFYITLKAFEIVEFIKSKTKPPAIVPSMPQTIVIPPNNISALLCKTNLSISQPHVGTTIV